jgi:hypothetical protein
VLPFTLRRPVYGQQPFYGPVYGQFYGPAHNMQQPLWQAHAHHHHNRQPALFLMQPRGIQGPLLANNPNHMYALQYGGGWGWRA